MILVGAELTIWQTAAAPSSQMFILIGTAPLVPIILGYMAFVYWLFRGKVREGEGYHSRLSTSRRSWFPACGMPASAGACGPLFARRDQTARPHSLEHSPTF